MSRHLSVPPFTSPWFLRGGHRQTLAGVWARQRFAPETARQHLVCLSDGDTLVLHDDLPPQWRAGDRVALMVHGLAGSHASPYMRRIAARLNARGVRTLRLDQRTCGAGLTLAQRAYHCGRSDDVRAALRWLSEACPGSPLALIGFSMGGSLVLKMAGEAGDKIPPQLQSVFAACPPLELQRCVRQLQRGIRRLYDQYFARLLCEHVERWQAANPQAPRVTFRRPPRSIEEFDDVFTAPLGGFASAADYYRKSSPLQFIPEIRVPTTILAAQDDPMVDSQSLRHFAPPPEVTARVVPGGGHLGFISRGGNDPDHWWLDWRVVDWVLQAHPSTTAGNLLPKDAEDHP